jgi:hypothetical protein
MRYNLRKLGENFYALAVFDIAGKLILLSSGKRANVTRVADEMDIPLKKHFKRVNDEYKRYREERMSVLRQEGRVLA